MAADLGGHAGADGADAGCAGEEELEGQWKSSKRRLTAKEVRVLEHNFVTHGPRLEQETKLRLARELALQPRQVAIWFQNRRARWKGKQLEKDFLLLKAEYLAFKDKYNALLDEKEKLAEEVKRLKDVESDKSSPECKGNLMPEVPAYRLDVDDFPALELGPAYPELGISDLDFISTSHVDSISAASGSSSCCCGVPSSDSIGLLEPDSGQTSQPCCCSLFEGMNVMKLLASPPQNGTQNCASPSDTKRDSAALSQQGMDPSWGMNWP